MDAIRNVRIFFWATAILAMAHVCRAQTGEWVHTNGPYYTYYPSGTEITAFAAIGNYVFAGTRSNGLLLSIDSGQSWNPESNFPAGGVGAIWVKGNSLFASGYEGSNIFVTSDSGSTWDTLVLPFHATSFEYITSFAVIGDTFLVATGSFQVGSVLYASTDNGNTWIDTIYDGIQYLAVAGSDIYGGLGLGGVVVSSDNGFHWTKVQSGSYRLYNIVALQGTIYVMTSIGTFSSTDNGAIWVLDTSVFPRGIGSIISDGKNLYASGSGVFVSSNSGISWSACGDTGLTSGGGLLFANDGILYAGSEGIYSSSDNGAIWKGPLPPPPTPYLLPIPMDDLDTVGDNLFACTQGGLFATTDSGASWTLDSAGMSNIAVTAVLSMGDTLFAGTSSNGLFFSTNNGASWVADTASRAGSRINVLVQNNGVLYTSSSQAFAVIGTYQIEGGTNGIYASTDSGSDWIQVQDVPTFSTVPIYSLAVLGQNIYAGTSGYGVWLSNDSGIDWIQANDSGLRDQNITALLVNGGKLYAGTMLGFVYVSSDSGATWLGIDSGLWVGSEVISIAIQDSNLYAGTPDSGIWRYSLSKAPPPNFVVPSSLNEESISIYPNPFSQSTQISFTSQSAGYAEVSIVNMLGVEVARLFSGELGAGEHNFAWDSQAGSPVPRGTYECVVRMNGQVDDRSSTLQALPMVLMR